MTKEGRWAQAYDNLKKGFAVSEFLQDWPNYLWIGPSMGHSLAGVELDNMGSSLWQFFIFLLWQSKQGIAASEFLQDRVNYLWIRPTFRWCWAGVESH